MPKSPEEMAQSMINNLKEKTGKTLPQWLKIARGSGEAKHGAIVKFLKTGHGVTHGYANLIAAKALEGGEPGDPVEAQYSGGKEGLKPIYTAFVRAVKKLGKDVEISPKKTYVSLRRNKQFALIQPSTKTRVDVGLNLKGVRPAGRLESSGSFNAMCTHRVRLESKKDVDAELEQWLREAYERA